MRFYPGIQPGKLTLRTFMARLKHIARIARMERGTGNSIDDMLDAAQTEDEDDE